jgi:hypothetical protein
LSREEEIKGKLQILFEGTPIENVHLIEIKILNSGNVPITSTDYERAVNFRFGDKAHILTAEVTDTTPKELRATANIQTGNVVLTPILLNNGDSITFRMLVSQFHGEILVDGRIIGVKEIKQSRDKIVQYFVITVIGMVMMLIGTFLGMRASPSKLVSEQMDFGKYWPYYCIMAIGSILYFVGFVIALRSRWFSRLSKSSSVSRKKPE